MSDARSRLLEAKGEEELSNMIVDEVLRLRKDGKKKIYIRDESDSGNFTAVVTYE